MKVRFLSVVLITIVFCNTIIGCSSGTSASTSATPLSSGSLAIELSSTAVEAEEEALLVDKDDLESIIYSAKDCKKTSYTKSSYKKLTKELKKARVVYENEDVSQSDVDSAAKRLRNAYYDLCDISDLKKAIKKAKKYKAKKYTVKTYSRLTNALGKAQAVCKNNTASQKAIDSAESKLKKSISGLKKRPPTFTGYGDGVVKVPSKYSMATVKATHNGGSNFAIWSLTKSKERIDLLVNTIGSYNGVTLMGVEDDIRYLQVTASGSWKIILGDPWSAPKVKNGKNMRGDAVVRFDKDSVNQFKLQHSGSGNFAVRGYGQAITSYDLIVNEIGNVKGKYLNYGYYLLEVMADGSWKMSW